MDNLISENSAKEQLNLLLEFYDTDLEELGDDDKMRVKIERKLVKAIMQGKIEVENSSEEFLVKQTIKDGTQFVYHEIDGTAKVRMDTFEGKYERLYGLLAILAKKKIEKIQQIKGKDLTIAEYLGLIFLMD